MTIPSVRRVAALLLCLSVSVVSAGCGDSGPARSDVLGALADQVVIPSVERLDRDAAALSAAVTELCATASDDATAAARASLAALRSSWSHTESMHIGPMRERRTFFVVEWPIDEAKIEELVADPSIALDPITLATAVGADQRGLGAVEYLISTDDAIARLSESRRCEYLTGVVQAIASELSHLPDDWTVAGDGGEPYRDVFAADDGDDLDAIVNEGVFSLRRITDSELGAALGLMNSTPDLEALVEGDAGLGVADLAASLIGMREVLVGDGTEVLGLSPLLGDDLTARLTGQLDAADAAIAALDPPLRTAVTDDPAGVTAVRDTVMAVQVTLTTEVAAQLGVTIGFGDADGDTG